MMMNSTRKSSVMFRLFLVAMILAVASALKPVRNLQVSCRDETYVINDVTTVEELMARLQKRSGIPSNDLQPAKVVHKGKVLEPGDALRQAGVQDGSRLLVITGNYPFRGKEVLAMLLQSLNEEGWEKAREQWQNDNKGNELMEEFFKSLKELKYVTSQDVSNYIRNGLDVSYHHLRRAWDHPAFRQALHDPMKIEAYRQVIETHLPKNILKDIPGAQRVISNPDLWRQQVLKTAAGLERFGDALLDGILEIVLDVLKGAGRTTSSSSSSSSPAFGMANGKYSHSYQPQMMEDPSLANNLLSELSESEDESPQ